MPAVSRSFADLDYLEAWLARNSPTNAAMTVRLVQFERMVRITFRRELRISYSPKQTDGVVEVGVDVDIRSSNFRSASLAFCCHAGRFFKQYGPSREERIFFKGVEDAAQYIVFVLNEYLQRESTSKPQKMV